MDEVLKLLMQNARLSYSEMAVLLGKEESEVAKIVESWKKTVLSKDIRPLSIMRNFRTSGVCID
jgi:DNA-binding Lrp family transcriptional regulator